MGNNDSCAICGDTKANHFSEEGYPTSRHSYTLVPGDLRPSLPVANPKRESTPDDAMGRLLSILLTRGVIDAQDALAVVGVIPPHKPTEPK